MGDSRFLWFTSLPKNALDRRCVYCTCKHRPQHLTQFFGAFYFVFFICLYFFLHSSWFTFNLMLIHISKVEDGIFSSPMSKQKQDYSATLFNERMYYSSLRYSVVCFETVLSHRWCNHATSTSVAGLRCCVVRQADKLWCCHDQATSDSSAGKREGASE